MAAHWLGRVAQTVLSVWLIASAVFLLSRRNAEAAIRLALPDASDLNTHQPLPDASQAVLQQAIGRRLGLQQPLFYFSHQPAQGQHPAAWHWHGRANQYHQWLRQLLHGNFGTSYRTGQPVGTRLREALVYTVPLTGTAALLAAVAAIVLAQVLAARPRWQRLGRAALGSLAALPGFVVALALLLLLANPDVLAWFPAYGLAPTAPGEISFRARLADLAAHLTLPVIALVVTALPGLTLSLEASLSVELQADYVTTARAKGAPKAQVVRHALRNALLPFIAQLADLLPALVAGAVTIEVVFALPGMGRLVATAAATHDYPLLVGGVILTGAARLLALLLADVVYFWADPRIRWAS